MIVRPIPKINCYELCKPLAFWVMYRRCTVPEGFVSDGASIHKLFWTITTSPFHPKIIRGAFIHDYLYRVHVVSREVADLKLKTVIISDGISKELAETIHSAVRVAGKRAYVFGPQKPLIGVYNA